MRIVRRSCIDCEPYAAWIKVERETHAYEYPVEAEAVLIDEVADLSAFDVLYAMFNEVPGLPPELGLDLAHAPKLLGAIVMAQHLDTPHRRSPIR